MPSALKSRRQVRMAMKYMDKRYPYWRKDEEEINELAKLESPNGEAIDKFLERLYLKVMKEKGLEVCEYA